MSEAVTPASFMAFAAASMASPTEDMLGTFPISVDSAAPTIAVEPGGIMASPRRVQSTAPLSRRKAQKQL